MFIKQNYYKKAISCIALATVFAMYSCQQDEFQASPELEASTISDARTDNKIAGQYIVVFKNNQDKPTGIINSLIKRGLIEEIEPSDQLEGVVNGFVAKLTPKQVELLQNHPNVDYIEQDQVAHIAPDEILNALGSTKTTKSTITSVSTSTQESTSTTNFTYTALPGETVPQGVDLVGYEDGTGKTAWIIDSGVDINNTNLNVDVARSKSFLTTTTSVQDGYGHGTMIAGIIGAKNNGAGIIGVAANATIVALRVGDNAGVGTVANAIKAVNHVGTYGNAGDVINISLSAPASATYDNVVKAVAAKGIFFAIAAGNSNTNCSTTSPQRVNATNVYTVSAMDYNMNFWASSSWGAPVDRCAPGVNITSLKIGGGTQIGSGTSFAAPHVAGLLLLKGNLMNNIGYVTGDPDSTPDLIPHL